MVGRVAQLGDSTRLAKLSPVWAGIRQKEEERERLVCVSGGRTSRDSR